MRLLDSNCPPPQHILGFGFSSSEVSKRIVTFCAAGHMIEIIVGLI